jgi:hypothetical protein
LPIDSELRQKCNCSAKAQHNKSFCGAFFKKRLLSSKIYPPPLIGVLPLPYSNKEFG